MELIQGYKQTEVGLIPDDWELKNLIDIGEIATGTTPPTNNRSNYGEDYFFVSPADLGKGKYIHDTEKKLSQIGFDISRKFPANSILFTCIGSTIGKSGISKVALSSNQQINAIFPDVSYSSDFLFYYLYFISPKIKSGASEQAVPMINKTEFGKTKIALPNKISEQTAIATALSDIDELISQTEKLIDKKKAIKQGVMQELLKPKDGWVKKKLKEIAIFRRGSFPQPYGLEKWYDDITGEPFVQVFDVDDNKKLKTETKRYISNEAQKMSVFAKKGTIVLTIQGSIGRIAITQYDAYVDRTLLIFESYLVPFDPYFFMLTIHQLFEVEKQNAPGGIIKTITKEALSSFTIAYPNIKEQDRIGLVMHDIENEIVIFETKLNKLKLQKKGMMQALLTGKIRLL